MSGNERAYRPYNPKPPLMKSTPPILNTPPLSQYSKATLVSVLPPISLEAKKFHHMQQDLKSPAPLKDQYQNDAAKLHNIVLAQSLVRMWIMKRRYRSLQKNFRIRCEVVKEILTSEKRYNKQLQTMIQVFLIPLREALEERCSSHDESDNEDEDNKSSHEEEEDEDEVEENNALDYNEDDIFQIFSHLETIYNLSNVLIGLLEDKYAHGWRAHRTLGDVFIQIGPYLKTLKQYVENYENSLQTLERLKEDSDEFSETIEEMEEDPRCQCLDLGSLLIVPVQRVPRYILLLDTLLRNTPPDHPDHQLLTQAIDELKKVTTFINKGLGGNKDFGVLAYLQGLADAQGESIELIKTHRKMIKHGVVTKKSFRDNESTPRELYLLTDILVVVADIMNVVTLQRIDKMVPLITSTVIDNSINDNDSISFIVASPIKTFLFVCGNMEMKLDWMSAIQTAITDLMHAHPNNLKQRQEWSVDFKNNQWQVVRVTEELEQVEVEQEQEYPKGVTQLAQLQKLLNLSNKGKIRIKKACIGLVEEVSGTYLVVKDQCEHYSGVGTFLVFPPSEKVLWLFPLIGFITITNKGTMARLFSHVRECGKEHHGKHKAGKFYDLLSGETKRFPFRGHWTIEVVGGDCAELQVVSFSNSHGDSLPDLLGMVH